jgi:predicted nucleotidyltransferase
MTQVEQAKKDIEKLKDKTQFEKMLGISGILTRLFNDVGLQPIIVGGLAVEIYTRGEYTTRDIDFIFSQRHIAEGFLERLNFKQHGRHYYHEELLVSIEIPDDMLEDADYNKVTKLNLKNGDSVFVIGIEDIILDRLRACKHWKSSSDCEWGKRMFLLHKDNLDLEYMKECTKRDLTHDIFANWVN